MLKLNLRRLAASAVALGTLAALTASAQTPGITEGDSQPAPRRSSPSTGDTAPELDSRVGGELGTGVGRTGVGDAADDAVADPEDIQRRTFIGRISGVTEDRLTVEIDPPGADAPSEQTFRLGEGAAVIVNGEPSAFTAVRKGQSVRLITAPGDPELIVRLFAATRRARPAGEGDENFDVYPQADQDTPPRRRPEQPGGRRQVAMTGGEEAVLPLGIEVYGGGRQGALVTEMLADGPAAAAGVLINDIIVAINGQPISDTELIEQQLAAGNGAAELTILRNGETLQLPLQPGQLVEGSLTTANAMQQALVTAGFIAGGGLRNQGAVGVGTGVGGTATGVGTGVGTGGTIVPPADQNEGAPGLTPRSPGRSDAAEGGVRPGRSGAAPGGEGSGIRAGGNNPNGTNSGGTGTGTNTSGTGTNPN